MAPPPSFPHHEKFPVSFKIWYAPDPAFSKGDVLGHSLVQVVAYHEHVQMFVDGVERVRPAKIPSIIYTKNNASHLQRMQVDKR